MQKQGEDRVNQVIIIKIMMIKWLYNVKTSLKSYRRWKVKLLLFKVAEDIFFRKRREYETKKEWSNEGLDIHNYIRRFKSKYTAYEDILTTKK